MLISGVLPIMSRPADFMLGIIEHNRLIRKSNHMATWRGKMVDSIETRLVVNVDSVDPVCIRTRTKSQTLRPPTLLSRLRTADPADIPRPRKVKKNAASSKKLGT